MSQLVIPQAKYSSYHHHQFTFINYNFLPSSLHCVQTISKKSQRMFANSNFYIYAMLLLRCADLFLHSRPKVYLAHAKDLRQISVKNWLLLAKRDFRFLLNQIKHQSFSQIITEQIASKERLCQVV